MSLIQEMLAEGFDRKQYDARKEELIGIYGELTSKMSKKQDVAISKLLDAVDDAEDGNDTDAMSKALTAFDKALTA